MEVIRGVIKGAQKVVVYGPEGIGKTTFASHFPDPLFIDTEGSTKHLDVARLPKPSSWAMLLEQVKYVKQHPDCCKTLVIDTADWAEQLCTTDICAKKRVGGIEDIGYGRGYVYLAEEFGRLLNLMTELTELNIHAFFAAHAQMRKFEQPDEMGAYDRWELKLQKKTAPLLKEWADLVLFANYKTYVLNVDGQGVGKGKNKVAGGKRIIYTSHHPCWDAKNRMEMPDELPLDYAQIAQYIEGNVIKKATTPEAATPPPMDVPRGMPEKQENREHIDPEKWGLPPLAGREYLAPLYDLMAANLVHAEDIQAACEEKGYYPKGTPLTNYDPEFVKGVLIGAWPQVLKLVTEIKNDLIPF